MKQRAREAAFVAALLALVAVPTVRTLAAGPAICTKGPSDVLAQNVPMARWFHDAVRAEGGVPLWRSSQFYGHETVTDPQQRVLYPPFYVYAALAMPHAHHVFWLLHTLLLAGGTYALARGERSSRLSALLAGVMLGLCFKTFTYLMAGWDNIYCSLAWMPLALAGFRRACATGGAGGATLMALCLAAACLAGTPMLFAFLALALPVAALAAARRRRRVVLALALGFGAGFALAAPQLLCGVGASARSSRADLGLSYGTTLERDVIGALFFPYFGAADYAWEFASSFGFAALPLVGAGIARRPRSPWLLLAAALLLLAAGDATPIGVLVAKLPLVGTLSYLSRLVWLALIPLAVLAARGFDALERLGSFESRRARRIVLGLVAGFALLVAGALVPGRVERVRPADFSERAAREGLALEVALAGLLLLAPLLGRSRRRVLLGAVVAATALELLLLAELVLVRVPWSSVTTTGAIEEALAKEPRARLAVVTSKSIWFDPVVPFYAAPGIERADGYNPLHERATERFLYSIGHDRINRPGQGGGHMYGLWAPYVGLQGTERPGLLALGATHVATHEPLPGFEVLATEERRFCSPSGAWLDETVSLQRVPDAAPRAFLMTRALPEGEGTQRMAMRRGKFDGRRTLLLEGPIAPERQGEAPALPVEIVERREGLVRLRASVPAGGGWVVLLDAFSPRWHATVDGAPAVVERADAIFRAVRVEAGERVVEMRIGLPPELLAGCGVALAGVAALALAHARARPRVRRGRGAAPLPPG